MKSVVEPIIKKIRNKIPTQGPLEYFIHHNTIHHYEDIPFIEAVKKAAIDYSCNAFMPEAYYRQKYNNRIIKRQFFEEAIKDFIKEQKLNVPSDVIYNLLIKYPLYKKRQPDKRSLEAQKKYANKHLYYHGALFKKTKGISIGFYSAPLIYKFCQAYFDYGNASWLMPHREKGMWHCFKKIYRKRYLIDIKVKKNLSVLIKQYENKNSEETVYSLIQEQGIKEAYIEGYIFEVIIKHKGWAGFIKSLEEHPEWVNVKEIIPCFIDFVAIVLLCNRAAAQLISKNKIDTPVFTYIPQHSLNFLDNFFETTDRFHELEDRLKEALPLLTDVNRQEIFHKAYEKSFYFLFTSSYYQSIKKNGVRTCKYQAVCCIDEREESFRRYLELNDHCETFGCAGHFGLNILYKSYFDKHYRALCPIVVKPEYKVHEELVDNNQLALLFIHFIGQLQWWSLITTKTLIRGYVNIFLNFFITTIPTACEIIDAKLTYKLKKTMINLKAEQKTILKYKLEEQVKEGISFKQQVIFARNFLQMIGLTYHFSPYVFIFGHGSISLNNPHEAAHDCGACGGGRGAPNARLMATILNDKAIREALKKENITIPSETRFIGAYHNTCSDELDFFDIGELYEGSELLCLMAQLQKAAALDAKERCRRFNTAYFGKKLTYYTQHVNARVLDIRQPRPEYGHATNALCIVGPRALTRDLFLDRRAFLVSYSPKEDNDDRILTNIVNTAIPVCAGINLEYYFSFVDNEFYGCGTKLPHNVTSLIGVMNGYMSDLRPGLPWQMVEIHQPVRLLVLIYCALKSAKNLLGMDTEFTTLVKNGWIKLIIHDCHDDQLWMYSENTFIKYQSNNLCQRYILPDDNILNTKEHVEFGRIVR